LIVVTGRDFVSVLRRWPVVLSLDESECDRVSERDRLGLTPNLTTRETSGKVGNENFVYSSLWDIKSSFTTWDLPALLPIREEGVLRIFIALKNP
jgi:hypothetical protein